MASSAAVLVFELHGAMLRSASQHVGRHFQGLGQAGRSLRSSGHISSSMMKKLIRIDDTFNVMRHITSASVSNHLETFQKELADSLAALDDSGGGSPCPDGQSSCLECVCNLGGACGSPCPDGQSSCLECVCNFGGACFDKHGRQSVPVAFGGKK